MKKSILFLILLFSILKSNAQSYMGYFPDNYAGVQGVIFNPATIVDSRFRTDINLFSTSSSLNNDFYGLSLFDLQKDSYDANKEGVRTPTLNNGAILYSDVMGPSFMFNIAPKHSVAFFTRARAVVNAVDINGNLYDEFKDGLDDASSFMDLKVGNPNIVAHTWGEVGATYAAVLWQSKQHFLKGGFTAKYLIGGLNTYAKGNDISSSFVQTNDPNTTLLVTTGALTIGSSQDIVTGDEDFVFDTNSTGFGADIGFIYEWRPDYANYDLNNAKPTDNNFKDLNKYKLRFGLSVTDFGTISYKNSKEENYTIDGVVTQQEIDDADNLGDFLEQYYGTPVIVYKTIKANLPTVMHLDIDWNLYKKFYLNLNGNISLVDKSLMGQTSAANTYILTPRYETKWFTFSLPINYMEYSGMQVGSGLRFGPIFLGSSSIITNIVSKESKAADVYFGIKIPVYQKKLKDTDEDGVLDKDDDCPKIAGPIENKGCPWPDADADTVADKDDKCPTVAGPVENNGCPWGDADKDTVMDNVDGCPTVAGPIENKGCPWPDTDNDGLADKDDKCPTVQGPIENQGCPIILDADKDGVPDTEDDCPLIFGPVSNKGCPEVTQKVVEELRVQARAIFFVTGKATLQSADKGETNGRLDAIKEILKNYPNARFEINGHTDNVGKKAINKKLSEDRAKAVVDALVARGINPENLKSQGFGDTQPVASNKTAKGRAENRRTEIIYVGGPSGMKINLK